MRPGPATLLFLFAAAVLAGTAGCSTQTADIRSVKAERSVSSSPEDREIASALASIDKTPNAPLAYDRLASLYIKQARRTGDFALNIKAESAVKQALTVAPDDLLSRKLQASLHLTFHRFGEALELGKQLQNEVPSDSFIYGVLTDANAELGNYDEAVAAAQKMVDLKPGSLSYARVGHMRILYGDHPGAVEMFKQAARTADPQDKESQSWCLVQLGDALWNGGKYPEAERVYDEALQNFPDYYLALAGKGRIRAAQNDLPAAEKFLIDAQNRFPNPETIVLLGDLYKVQGNEEKAAQQYDLVNVVEQKFGVAGDQKRLALMWADRNINLDEALAIAEREHGARKDIYTADIYAWCLYKNDRLAEAKIAAAEAMRLNTKDARIKYHAGMIEKALGNNKEAVTLIADALKLNPSFDLIQADVAKRTLEEMKTKDKRI